MNAPPKGVPEGSRNWFASASLPRHFGSWA